MGNIQEVRVFDTGHCLASEHYILQGGQKRAVQVHCLVGLLRHSEQGWILFDTGYAPRMLAATQDWPYRLYRWATPFVAPPELAICEQLKRASIDPEQISHIIISHFHADHVAGLLDFPKAKLICSRAAYQGIAQRTGYKALLRAYLPQLIPLDFKARASFIEAFQPETLPGLGPTCDLFGDGSLRLVSLPGHAQGQIGLLAETAQGSWFFVADGAWYRKSIRDIRPPTGPATLFVDDMQAVGETLNNLHLFAEACPTVTLMPTHCPEAYQQFCA